MSRFPQNLKNLISLITYQIISLRVCKNHSLNDAGDPSQTMMSCQIAR